MLFWHGLVIAGNKSRKRKFSENFEAYKAAKVSLTKKGDEASQKVRATGAPRCPVGGVSCCLTVPAEWIVFIVRR